MLNIIRVILKSKNGLKSFPSKGLNNFYRLQYYDDMYFDKMCEGGPRRLVQCDGNAGLRPGWAPGQHWAKERLGEKSLLV